VPSESWLIGLQARGASFAGYLARVGLETPNSFGDRPGAGFAALLVGDVHPDLREATIGAGRVNAGAAVVVPGAQGYFISRALYIGGQPVFGTAAGVFGEKRGFVDARGRHVELPDDSFTAAALRLVEGKGTFVDAHGAAHPYAAPEGGIRFCAGSGGELSPVGETVEGDVVKTTSCTGATLRLRRDGKGRFRDVSANDGPWKPLGSRVGSAASLLAEPLGDTWLVHGPGSLEPHDEVLLFDQHGDRLRAPSPGETVREIADYPSGIFEGAVVVSWLLPLASLVLLFRVLRLSGRFWGAPGSLEGRVAGVFTGVMEGGGVRVGGALVSLGQEWSRVCGVSGAALEAGDSVELVAAVEEHPATEAYREAEGVALVPVSGVRGRRTIALAGAADRAIGKAFAWLLVLIALELPVPLVLLGRLGLGPYYP
jgi:hypothetical protein